MIKQVALEEVVNKVLSEPIRPHFAIANVIGSGVDLREKLDFVRFIISQSIIFGQFLVFLFWVNLMLSRFVWFCVVVSNKTWFPNSNYCVLCKWNHGKRCCYW